MAERRLRGLPASPGLALGPLVRLEATSLRSKRRQASPPEERDALERAIATAMADLEALATVASGDGADMLAFQIEMLGDPALVEGILPAIDGGEAAPRAWRAGLDRQIVEYRSAGDDYFAARASDLDDLKDRVLRALDGTETVAPNLPESALILADDLAPSRFLALPSKRLAGIALIKGSRNGHVAILARGRGLPMVVGLGDAADEAAAEDGVTEAVLDGNDGTLLLAPEKASRKRCRQAMSAARMSAERAALVRNRPAITTDGRRIEVLINVDDPEAVDDGTLAAADGVGLLRTEFLLMGRQALPDEDEHFQTYLRLQQRLDGKELTIRTLDIGGDKPLPGLELPKEQNPFLGLRGIRLCLDLPDLFRPQVRALLRAAAIGPLEVMLPMVAVQAELDEANRIFADCLETLQREGVEATMPPLGIMVETPAAAITADRLNAAFFSIGSNDLIQYVMAASRDGTGRVAALLDPGHVAIERLIKMTVDHGAASGKTVSLCGDMASDPAWLPLLLRTGLRKLSVAPAALDRVKLAIKEIEVERPNSSKET